VGRFEEAFGALHHHSHALAVNSGTSALHTALGAAGISPGDEVIVPAITWFATATVCLHQGAIPVFADVDAATGMMTVQAVEACLTSRTRAVIVVHLFGYPAEIAALRRWADAHGLVLVEDAAQALGARLAGRYLGTWGHLGAFSLQQSKSITSGDGGVVVTTNGDLARRAAMFADHGLDRANDLGPEFLGYNYRMTELQGAVAHAQLGHLEAFNEQRRANHRVLAEGLAGVDGLVLAACAPEAEPAWWLVALRLDPDAFTVSRDEFLAALRAEGIPAGTYPRRPVYLEPLFREKTAYARTTLPFSLAHDAARVAYRAGLCPAAERYLARQITLPCHHALNEDDMRDIVTALRKVVAGTRR
jgi:dTDP-4-amino-4,6-dideoxygalactose transaminase